MKKSLSLLVAIAMVFSMFATVVSAAEEPTAGEYLNELGVILGNQDGDLKEDQTWKRQDIVVLLSRLFGAEDEAKGAAKTHKFTDVTDKNYDGYISWAVEEGLVKGKSATVFGFGDELENRDFYLLVLRALGQEVEYDKVGGAAVEAGLAPEDTDFDAIPLRGETYTAIVAALKTPVGENGETLEELLGLVEAAAITSTQTGAKQVTVKFNKAIDTEKAKFAVKNGASTREVAKTTFSADKTSAVLEFSTKLLDGASSVTVTGLSEQALVADFTAQAEKITAIEFTSDKLALGSAANNAADYSKVSVGYKIVNQFEEDVTRNSGGTLTFQVGKSGVTPNATNGVLQIAATSGSGATFQIGETVYVNAILNLGTYGITANKSFTVGQQAVVDTVDILSLYHPENKELTTSSKFEDYLLLVDAKDQYGNNVTLDQFKAGVFAIASNGTLFSINKDHAKENVGPDRNKIGIPLTSPNMTPGFVFDGTNTVRITTLFGQKSDSIDIAVKKAPTVTTITLQQPTVTVVPNATVKVPFEAFDQNGGKLENYTDLQALHLTTNSGTFTVKQDFTNKKAFLEWKVGTIVGDAFLTATIPGTATTSQLQVKIVAADDPRAVAGLKDVKTTVVKGDVITIEPKHVVIKDQFDRDMKLADLLATHSVKVSVYDGATYNNEPLAIEVPDTTPNAPAGSTVLVGNATISSSNGSIKVVAKAKGTATVKLTLVKNAGTVEVSTYNNFAITVIDSGAVTTDSYQVADIEKVHVSGLGRGAAVKVTGKLSNGTEVTLPTDAYTVSAIGNLGYDKATNKVYVANNPFGTDVDKTQKATFTVHILATSTPIVKEVTITSETVKPTTFELKDATGLKAADGVVRGLAANLSLANVLNALKVKDQFGAELTNPAEIGSFYASISEPDGVDITNNGALVNATTDSAAVSNIALGDSYTVTFTSQLSGKAIKVKVVAVDAL